jgi:hypothetical protein
MIIAHQRGGAPWKIVGQHPINANTTANTHPNERSDGSRSPAPVVATRILFIFVVLLGLSLWLSIRNAPPVVKPVGGLFSNRRGILPLQPQRNTVQGFAFRLEPSASFQPSRVRPRSPCRRLAMSVPQRVPHSRRASSRSAASRRVRSAGFRSAPPSPPSASSDRFRRNA